MNDEPRIGVFVCECGDKIAGSLDVPAITRQASVLPGVKWADQSGHWCSPSGLERMRAFVAERDLDRVVIAGCAPRTHAEHFRQALKGSVNPALVNVTNLRDLCARPHQDHSAAALSKAHDQVAMAVADLAARQPGAARAARITPHAVVIGGGIAGMTAALSISDAGIPVTLVEREPDLGGPAHLWPDDHEVASLVAERMTSIRARPNVQVLTGTQVIGVSGPVGCYQVALSSGQVIQAGAIVVATGGRRDTPAIKEPARLQPERPTRYAFWLCDMSPENWQSCSHSCCLAALRQAAEIKRQVAGSQATIFFRELYTAGGTYDELVWEAQRQGVSFVRYPSGWTLQAADGQVVTHDELTGREVRVPCDVVIHAAPVKPQPDAQDLARMLRLPTDSAGFMADTRVRLRPADRIERGIYVCGAAHYPGDARRATFEAYSAAARAVHHIQRKEIANWATPAAADAARCNGCGDCVKVCPFMAVTLAPRPGARDSRLAQIDPLLCTGCGNCVSVCPVRAAQVPSATDEQIEAQIRAALRQGDSHLATLPPCLPPSPLLIFACEWSGYSAAEIAGARGLAYPASTRIIRLNCTGRLQPGLILKALEMSAAGVMILGCAPGMCHYEQGNERCAAAFEQANGLARLLALDDRLKLEWIPPDDGEQFVQTVSDFVAGVRTRERKT